MWSVVGEAAAPIAGWILFGTVVLIVALALELWWYSRETGYCNARNLTVAGHCQRRVVGGGTCWEHTNAWKLEDAFLIIVIGVVGSHIGGIY